MDTQTAKVLSTLKAPFTTGPSDGMAWDGSTLWFADERNHLYQVDRTSWKVLNSLSVPVSGSSNPRGLAWDNRSNNVWAGYQTTTDGVRERPSSLSSSWRNPTG